MSLPRQGDPERYSPTVPPSMQIFFMSQGVILTTALSLAAELGIADQLAEGPRDSDELAEATGTHSRSLYRVLRLLGSVGVFTEVRPRCFAVTPLGECLRTGVPGSMRSWVRMVAIKPWFDTYQKALQSVRTGEPAFQRATGTDLFDYLAEIRTMSTLGADGANPAHHSTLNRYNSDDWTVNPIKSVITQERI